MFDLVFRSKIEPNFDLPFHCQSKFLQNISDEYGWIIDEKNQIGLPIVIKSKYFFRFVILYGNLFHIENGTICIENQIVNNFYKSLYVFFKKKLNVDAILTSPVYLLSQVFPKNANSILFGTIKINLRHSIEVLWADLHTKHRNSVRMAEKLGCEFHVDHSKLGEVIKLINETHQREGISLVNQKLFHTETNYKVVYVSKNKQMISAALFFYANEGAYYLYGGNSKDHEKGSMNFLHWHSIIYFKQIGVKSYDFVGVRIGDNIAEKYKTLRRFKERFGGTLVIGYLWKQAISPKFKVLSFILSYFSKSKIDVIDHVKKNEK